MRTARVFNHGRLAGHLKETEAGFVFTYIRSYLLNGEAISLTLPVRPEPYAAPMLFPFFYGLLAEGSTREIQHRVLKIDEEDVFGLLLATCEDAIGSVSIEAE
jgi:serine/threonine-protein kinase HipA